MSRIPIEEWLSPPADLKAHGGIRSVLLRKTIINVNIRIYISGCDPGAQGLKDAHINSNST